VTVGASGAERAYLSSFTASVQNVDVVEQVTLPRCAVGSCDAFVIGRSTPGYTPTYYQVGVVQGTGADILLRAQRSDGTALASDTDTGLAAADGARVMLRVEFQGASPTTIRARAWLAGTAEPTTWLLNTADSNGAEQAPGMLGVRFQNEDTGTAHPLQYGPCSRRSAPAALRSIRHRLSPRPVPGIGRYLFIISPPGVHHLKMIFNCGGWLW